MNARNFVTVEYDCRGKRKRRVFADANTARRFQERAERENRKPVIVAKVAII